MKYFIAIAIVFVVLLGGAALLLLTGEDSAGTPNAQTSSPTPNYQSTVTVGSNTSTETPTVTEQTVVKAYNGTGIRTNTFMASSTEPTKAVGGEAFLVGSYGGNDRYRVSYYEPQQTFVVMLLSEPLKEMRELAQNDLLRILGISESDACSLLYVVAVPGEVNPIYQGKNLGFSFCEGAIPL